MIYLGNDVWVAPASVIGVAIVNEGYPGDPDQVQVTLSTGRVLVVEPSADDPRGRAQGIIDAIDRAAGA